VSEHDGFRVERDDSRALATITLDVPGKFNRVSMLARDQLRAVFEELDRDEGIRFVVLTGAGGAFTAGGDIPGFLEKSPWHVSRLADNVAAPERCTKPVIAALRGYVFGVGLELALACDFRLAADDVQLGFPEVTIGMIPGSGGTQRLARLVGLGRAKDIVMRGRRVHAEEALALGLVTEVVPGDELDAAVAGWRHGDPGRTDHGDFHAWNLPAAGPRGPVLLINGRHTGACRQRPGDSDNNRKS